MDHIRGAHDVPWEIKSASLEKYLSPWTVMRKVQSDSLTAQHSGISTDVLLLSNIHLSLVHHYRIHKRGLPHIVLSQLHALLPLQVVQPADGVVSPDSSSSGSLRPAESPEVMDKSPRTTRSAYRRRRPVRVMESPVENIPVLTIQDPLAVAGAVVLDCRRCLYRWTLVALTCRRVGFRRCRPVWTCFPMNESCCAVGGGELIGLICPELGVLVDPGTDLSLTSLCLILRLRVWIWS